MGNIRIYPVIITKNDNDTVPYFVEIPALDGYTQGTDIPDAITNARDYIGLVLMDKLDSKEPLPRSIFKTPKIKDAIVNLIDVDVDKYKKEHDMKKVKKTVMIPNYLNEKGNEAGLNFSELLTKAVEKAVKA
ncbi:type II toxin-antitoxin system HicB family antitoxin [Liquorilactobacillus hordei]|uniref:HicB-like antitoxin of toxin-antitoxin system domain-containing protein n=1 Tax=Liquorilactobacillus hordei DSM 19519 TaxID=1423759 RepID=A0A0R1MKH9_9LACO|nr:type II toxin-antitoxin system HicB family antitoxin [Liquorilactobacillus hordei]KRL07993.1 hypothetical protein FC92_GL001064 [Liquorilactobacillus hordei DSM 19519]QYH51063.1 HicB family protein [Liquorilactobacillus hordei DSM 19519]